ncbi:NUDIX domain-containing protein [candidate division KSB1 bacterium]|nr:NUDIX domain-containing protein [candidate division KSB1 bacterium]
MKINLKGQRVAVIILDGRKILLIHRFRDGRDYHVIPGGHVEPGETLEETAIREIKEETGFDIELGDKIWEFENMGRLEFYFLANSYRGELQFGGPELKKMSAQNSYQLVWISLDELPAINLLPNTIKELILKNLIQKPINDNF